jgi:ribosomal protein L28
MTRTQQEFRRKNNPYIVGFSSSPTEGLAAHIKVRPHMSSVSIPLEADTASAQILGPILKSLKTSNPALFKKLLSVTLEKRAGTILVSASPLRLIESLAAK